MLWLIIAAVAVVAVVTWFKRCAQPNKPSYFRDPIPAGQYRVVACDEVGGAELNRVVGDYPSFETAQQEAARGRREAEAAPGSASSPTKFLIYDAQENFVGDWTGRKGLA